MKRMWINQPSSLESYHKWHGIQVLAMREYDDTYMVYFLEGQVISMQISRYALSEGWPHEENKIKKTDPSQL